MPYGFISLDHHWLTHWGWNKMAAIMQTTFLNLFLSVKMFLFWLKLHWNLFPKVQLTIIHHWFWCFSNKQATSYYLNHQWWPNLIYWPIFVPLGFHELKQWLVPCSASSHYFNQADITQLKPRNKLEWNLIQWIKKKSQFNILMAKCPPFFQGFNVLITPNMWSSPEKTQLHIWDIVSSYK